MDLRLLPLCIFRSAPHDCALSRTALHHQLRASKARALLIELQGYRDWSVRLNAMRDSARPKAKPNCVGCEAANLHQHLPGYEPVALPLSYRPIKWSDTPVLPRARLGPKPSEFAGSLVSDEKWTCAPGSHWVMRCCRPLARLFALRTKDEIGLLSRFRPDSVSSTKRSAAITL